MSKIQFSLDYLNQNCIDFNLTHSNDDWRSFKKSNGQYVYFIIWNESHEIFSWGTTSAKSDRIRKSSLLNDKLTGKYDRRVDYLMLKIIYGNPKIYIYEMPQTATIFETYLKQHFKQLHKTLDNKTLHNSTKTVQLLRNPCKHSRHLCKTLQVSSTNIPKNLRTYKYLQYCT